MKKIRHFRCEQGHATERFARDNEREITCPECERIAIRMLSAPKCFQNTTGRSPSA